MSKLPDRLSVAEPWTLAANCHLAKANLLPPDRARHDYERAVNLAARSISIDKASRAVSVRDVNGKEGTLASAADPHRIIAAAYLRLNQPEPALQAALKAQALDPKNVETYRQVADAYLAKHNRRMRQLLWPKVHL